MDDPWKCLKTLTVFLAVASSGFSSQKTFFSFPQIGSPRGFLLNLLKRCGCGLSGRVCPVAFSPASGYQISRPKIQSQRSKAEDPKPKIQSQRSKAKDSKPKVPSPRSQGKDPKPCRYIKALSRILYVCTCFKLFRYIFSMASKTLLH